jgi:hypothetical protein
VFSCALSLLLGVLSPALPASSVASDAAIAICFAPGEDCVVFAVRAIDNVEREIPFGAYGLTAGSSIVEALVRAKQRGVDVRLIADEPAPSSEIAVSSSLPRREGQLGAQQLAFVLVVRSNYSHGRRSMAAWGGMPPRGLAPALPASACDAYRPGLALKGERLVTWRGFACSDCPRLGIIGY